MSLFPKFQDQEGKITEPANPANPANRESEISEISGISNPASLDVLNPEAKKTIRLYLLTATERQAYDGWLWSAKQPTHGFSDEKAQLVAWQLLMESLQSFSKRGAGRYGPKNK